MGRSKGIVIITSSPRKGSGSAKAAVYLAQKTGLPRLIIDINRISVGPCIACGRCAKTFRCFQRDTANRIIEKIKNADVVITASPVYFTGVPGPLKIFIDRNQPVWEEYVKGKRGKKGSRKKAGVIILTAGSDDKKQFLPAETEIRSFYAVHSIKAGAVIRIGSADTSGFKKQPAVKRALEKAAGLLKNRIKGRG